MTTGDAFREGAITYLREGLERIGACLERLSPDEVWRDPNAHLVSIGNLILHLRGNVTQYIVGGVGGESVQRVRDEEFSAKPGLGIDELRDGIAATVEQAIAIIARTSDDDLPRPVTIQGFPHTTLSAILHVVEHFSYHTGQITLATKLMKDVDMGYYAGIDLNK